ncbi:MAG: alpha-E domain-containing protein [Gammaproteobacteria bacterium]|nr:MAG: alpha-E domain-containing protein [Gammaproteobacteria bacterium]
MTMLSRVADRLYWMSRYLERAENTARFTSAYTHLILDLPRGAELGGWQVLVDILDAEPVFKKHYRVFNEQNVLRFLIADLNNFSSINYAIKAARENVRTTRDVLPEETWEHVNELYIMCKDMAEKSVGRRHRYEFLEQIISRCQMINGLLMTTLCRDHPHRFIKLGHLMERADMTTRIVDVGAGAILERENSNPAEDTLLWSSMLQSLSAISAYRQKIGPLVEPDPAVNFIFKEQTLPRTVAFCLKGILEELAPLKNNETAIGIAESALRKLTRFDVQKKTYEELHQFIDQFQIYLCDLDDAITNTWFLPIPTEPEEA